MIRLTAIELENFKNVRHGRIALSSAGPDSEEWSSDIIGIYGQNGSGKTAVIAALDVLKHVWLKNQPPERCEDCIAIDMQSSIITASGVIDSSCEGFADCSFTYRLVISKDEDGSKVSGEKLTYRTFREGASKRTVFELSYAEGDDSIRPKSAWSAMKSLDKDLAMETLVAKRMAQEQGTSMLFSEAFRTNVAGLVKSYADQMRGGLDLPEKSSDAILGTLMPAVMISSELTLFAARHLAIVTSSRQAEPMLNYMRISTHESERGDLADISLNMNLNGPSRVPEKLRVPLEATIATVDKLMGALVPGLSIGVKNLGKALEDDGSESDLVELIATRAGTAVPLRCESEGIKKLATILSLLLDVYERPGSCVAIDEFDSGVFEFLLGEILQVLDEHGRGQLIFTAHNLRPLETLDKDSLVFTTTNPDNRYIPFRGSKATNNLRSQYLRAVNLGGQPEIIYEPTSKYEIDDAFYNASQHEHVGA